MSKIFIYNENCTMAGRPVPRHELERYDDPSEGGDWTGYEATEEEASFYENRGRYGARIAKEIREYIPTLESNNG